jgi:hypothetical protein
VAVGIFRHRPEPQRQLRRRNRLTIPGPPPPPEVAAGTLLGWYDTQEQTGYSQGNAVTSMTDFGGAGNTISQGTGANQPIWQDAAINGHPAVRHDGNDDRLVRATFTGGANAQPNTLVMVADFAAAPGTGDIVLLDGGTVSARHVVYSNWTSSTQGTWRLQEGTNVIQSGTVTFPTGPFIVRALFDGANSRLWVDDVLVLTGTLNTVSLNGATVGTWQDAAINAFEGDWGAVLYYDGDISATWPDLYDHLRTKWGFAAGAEHTAQIADAVAPTDSLSYVLEAQRALTDQIGPSDTLARAVGAARALDDQASPSDAISQAASFPRSITDTAEPTDALAYLVTILHSRVLDDQAAPTDLLTATQVLARALDDQAVPTDLLSPAAASQRALSDQADLTDALAYSKVLAVALDDQGNPTDSFTQTAGFPRTLTDLAGPSDQLSQAADFPRTLTDQAAPTDAISYLLVVLIERAIADSAAPTDSLARMLAAVRPQDDSAGPSDLLTQAATLPRVLSDQAGPSDQLSWARLRDVSLPDLLGASDALSGLQSLGRVVDDPAGLSDSLERLQAAWRAILDDAQASDDVTGIALAGIVPTWRGRVLVVVGAQSRTLGTGPTRVVPSGSSGVRGG